MEGGTHHIHYHFMATITKTENSTVHTVRVVSMAHTVEVGTIVQLPEWPLVFIF